MLWDLFARILRINFNFTGNVGECERETEFGVIKVLFSLLVSRAFGLSAILRLVKLIQSLFTFVVLILKVEKFFNLEKEICMF